MVRAWWSALKATGRAPSLVFVLWLGGVALTIPLAMVMDASIREHLDQSTAADTAVDGVNYDWWQEFLTGATGLAATFQPTIIGFAATLDNLSGVADGQPEQPAIMAVLAASALSWWLVLGGVAAVLIEQRPLSVTAAVERSVRHAGPLLALGAAAIAIYWLLFAMLHPWLFDGLFPRLTEGLPSERATAAWRGGLYALFITAVVALAVLLDYARFQVVCGRARNPFIALAKAALLVIRSFLPVTKMVGINTLTLLALLGGWFLLAPGVGSAGTAWVHFAMAQLYICARVFLRVQAQAGHAVLFADIETARTPAVQTDAMKDE